MYERPCLTHVDTASRLIHDQEAILFWIILVPAALNAQGTINVYDGWDAAGKLKCIIKAGYARQHCFCPPIGCNDALYIEKDEHVESYSLGFLPTKVAFPEDYKV
ncbi:hypothetical protein ES708_14013 [subsurface metagenome]